MKPYSIYLSFCFFITLFMISCNHERQVVPYETDIDEIFKPLEPEEESDSPQYLTFGKDKIHGFIFDFEIPSDSTEVYIFFENFTVMNVNPKINQSLFEFIQDGLAEYGFVNDSVSLPEKAYSDLINQGSTFEEASATLLDEFKTEFTAQLENIYKISVPFNAYFRIYPIYLDENYVTYRQSAYFYTGGAHGINITCLNTYDLSSGNILTLEDIIKPEGLKDIHEEVAAHMAYAYPIYENITTVNQYIDSLNVWLDNFNETDQPQITMGNFPISDVAITKEGLVFVYQMYELTPGSDGCPVVLIPYKDIRSLLKLNVSR